MCYPGCWRRIKPSINKAVGFLSCNFNCTFNISLCLLSVFNLAPGSCTIVFEDQSVFFFCSYSLIRPCSVMVCFSRLVIGFLQVFFVCFFLLTHWKTFLFKINVLKSGNRTGIQLEILLAMSAVISTNTMK